MKDASARPCVSKPVATWQYGVSGVTGEVARPAPNTLVPVVVVDSSGRCARTSQLSATVCPVLNPADTGRSRERATGIADRDRGIAAKLVFERGAEGPV